MSGYTPNKWVDREGITRYFETVDDDGALIFTPDYTQITEIGTPVNEDNMNHIEEGIAAVSFSKYDSMTTYAKDDLVTAIVDNELKVYKSLQDNNNGNPLTDANYWEEVEFAGGGGLEIGDIGIAPLGVDETQGKRRYLNGQIIIQEQFVTFTEKLKKAVELHPILACSEDDWQASVTMSAFGSCGKFVIDDEAGTIRLPKITGFIQGLVDLVSLGEIAKAGLPNITGTIEGIVVEGAYTGTGVFTASQKNQMKNVFASGSGTPKAIYTLDASRSSSVYGNSNTVQPEAVRYPYFIQVARCVEECIDVTRDIELNNPFSLLDYKYSEYELNNLAWLKSNGQWNPSTIYVSTYELLLKIYNGTVIKAGVSVKPATEEYADTDFVINTTDKSFRLPTSVANSGLGSLYFYIGETVQNANLVNIGRIEENFAGVVEVGGSIGMPSEKYIDLTLGADATIYTAPADGYYSLNMTSTGSQYMCMTNESNLLQSYMLAPATGWRNSVWLPVKKGDKVNIGYNYPQANVNWFRFIYAEGSKWEAYQ